MDIGKIIPHDEFEAIMDANTPSAANVFATMADIGSPIGDIVLDTVSGTKKIITNNVTPANRFSLSFIASDAMIASRDDGFNTGEVRVTGLASQMGWRNGAGMYETLFSLNETTISVSSIATVPFNIGSTVELKLRDNTNSFYGKFDIPTLGADVTYTFKDASGVVALEQTDIVSNAGAGVVIALASTDKLGFWGATTIVRPVHIVDPTAMVAIVGSAPTAMVAITGAVVGDTIATNGGWGSSTEAGFDSMHVAIDANVADIAAAKTAIDFNNAAIDLNITDIAALKTTTDSNKTAIDAILAWQATTGLTASA